jgi:AraC-like DNA-binding protein
VKAFLLESPETYDIKSIEVVVPPYFLLSSSAIWVYILLAVIAAALIVYYRRKRQARIAKMRVLKLGPQEMAFKHKEDYDFVKQQLDWLEEHYADSNLKIEDLVAQSSMSRTSYYNELKSLTGLSPKEFISDFRLKKALMYLDKSNNTIAEIAYNTGFNDPVYFTRIFKSKTGITPSKYRENKNKEENSRKENTPK